MHKQLLEQAAKSNGRRLDGAAYGAPRVASAIEAASDFISDGFDTAGQAQYIMRERGLSLSAGALAAFGRLTPCPILKLELGASVKLDALGKRTLLLFHGPSFFDSAQKEANHSPIVIGCLEGWKTDIQGGLSTNLGIGFGMGAGGSATDEGLQAKAEAAAPAWEKNPDEPPSSDEPKPTALVVAEAGAEFFFGLAAEASGGYEYYYASDDNVFLTGKDSSSNQNTVLQLVEEVLKDGSVKSGLKRSAILLIHGNPNVFTDGTSIKYDTWGGLGHISSADCIAALKRQKGPLTPALKTRVDHLIWGLLPFSGTSKQHPNITSGLTYVRLCGPRGAGSAKLGASVEASCASPIFSASLNVSANAFNVSSSSKRLYLSYQAVAGFTPRELPFVYFQDFTFKYTKSQVHFGEVAVEGKATFLGHEKTLDDLNAALVDVKGEKGFGGKDKSDEKEIGALIEELTQVWEFGAHEGASAAIAGKGGLMANTLTYKGVCFYYEQPSKKDVGGSSRVKALLGKGSGYVQGATFTLGLLGNIIKALRGAEQVLANRDEFFSHEQLKPKLKKAHGLKAHGKKLGEAFQEFRGLLSQMAGFLGVRLEYFYAFLKNEMHQGSLEDIARIDPNKGVLVEAAFSFSHTAGSSRSLMGPNETTFTEFERHIELEVNRDAISRTDNPPVNPPTVPSKASIKKFMEKGVRWTTQGRHRSPPQQIRLRFRMDSDTDSSITLPLGIQTGVASVSFQLKNVWHLELEGIPVMSYISFDKSMAARAGSNFPKERDLWVAVPLLFRC